jgi:cytochrome P450
VTNTHSPSTSVTATLPPGLSLPRFAQVVYTLAFQQRGMRRLRARYGDAFTVNLPIFGRALVISDPAQVKQLFTAGPDAVEVLEPNIGQVLGPGSLFGLTGAEHRKQRKLLVPPFHGRRLATYEKTIEEETARETASWPEGQEFATLPSMMRIAMGTILRTVFGAEGAELARLRDLLPPLVNLASWLAVLPITKVDLGRWSPWGRFWIMRREYDAIIEELIAKAAQDDLDQRDDILALLLQSRYDDGSAMSHSEIGDQLLTLLSAGQETTATTLAWTIERLRRHPDVLRELVEEADAGGSALREATILEVQRTRPVVDLFGRQVNADALRLGPWTLPKGSTVLVGVTLIHDNESLFPNAQAFDPHRFIDAKPDLHQWIPFGGGTRRCVGAAFANMEMNVTLRTILRAFSLSPTTERDERWRSRGIGNAPAKGGRAVVHRRELPGDTLP